MVGRRVGAILDAPDEAYNSASDEDFNPNNVSAVENNSSDEDEQSKLQEQQQSVEDLDFDNSGDEATIRKSRKRKRKDTGGVADDGEGGEGGLIKTRAQKRLEGKVKKPIVQAGNPSVDVNALWAQMANNSTVQARQKDIATQEEEDLSHPRPLDDATALKVPQESDKADIAGEETVVMKRTYEFAGQQMVEERVVSKSSAEARLYLEEQSRKTDIKPHAGALRRPKKRQSIFDTTTAKTGAVAKAPKLTTLEKSKLDWAAHVDSEGISDELDEHRRAKTGYLGRMDFLGRMNAKREEELRPKK